VKALVPQEMGVVLEGATLDPNNKDTVVNAVSHWLVELGELDATFRKSDIARLKSFVTQAVDKLRRPYDRIESEYQRRTVFFASVNEGRYLVDDTGNRRWWTVPVSAIDYRHGINMQQVWAELLTHFERGEQHWLTDDEQKALNALNADHEAVDPVEEMIAAQFDWNSLGGIGHKDMTASEVLQAIGYDKPNKAQATHASKVLKKLTGKDPRKSGSRRVFNVPPRMDERRRNSDDDRPF
jgi:putative DNA primase/helicase